MFKFFYWITRVSLISPFSFNKFQFRLIFSRKIASLNILFFLVQGIIFLYMDHNYVDKEKPKSYRAQNVLVSNIYTFMGYLSNIMKVMAISSSIRYHKLTQKIFMDFKRLFVVLKINLNFKKFITLIVLDQLIFTFCNFQNFIIILQSCQLWEIFMIYPISFFHHFVNQVNTYCLYFCVVVISRFFTELNRCLNETLEDETLIELIKCYTILSKTIKRVSTIFNPFLLILLLITICAWVAPSYLMFMLSIQLVKNEAQIVHFKFVYIIILFNLRGIQLLTVVKECENIQRKVFIIFITSLKILTQLA